MSVPPQPLPTIGDLWVAVTATLTDRGLHQPVQIVGELHRTRTIRNGHVVATLRDTAARIDLFVPTSVATPLREHLVDGVHGTWTVRLEPQPAYGRLQLILDDLDLPTVTVGDQAHQRAATWAQLEPYADHNRHRPVPGRIRRIAVITSPTGDAWHDIRTHLPTHIDPVLLSARTAGPDAVDDIVRQLRSVPAANADVVIVTRGGGDGMEWADHPDICQAIIDHPRPVWVAVGHATDLHLADRFAAHSLATPTAVGAALHVPDAIASHPGPLPRRRVGLVLAAVLLLALLVALYLHTGGIP